MDEYHSVKGLIADKDGLVKYVYDEGLYQYGLALLPYKPDKPNKPNKPKPKPSKKEQQQSKRQILYTATPYCNYCKKALAFNSITLDHIVPKCKGGSNDISNLAVSCYECNNLKGDKDLDEFLIILGELQRNKACLLEIRARQLIRKGRRIANLVEGKTGNATQRVNRKPSPIDDIDVLLEILEKIIKK